MGSTTAVAAVINIVINIIFIPKFGIYAATFSTLISNIVVYFYRRYKIMDYIKLKEKFKYVFWILLVITLITYYKNNMILNIIVFLLVVAYCIFTNKNFIMRVSKPVISKVQSFTKRNKKLN